MVSSTKYEVDLHGFIDDTIDFELHYVFQLLLRSSFYFQLSISLPRLLVTSRNACMQE